MKKLLRRQIEKYLGNTIPDIPGFHDFLNAIDSAYDEAEKRNRNLENILEVSTSEATTEVENFRQAIDEASLVVIIGRNGKITTVNNQLLKLTGLKTTDFLNTSIKDLLVEGQETLLNNAIAQLSSGKVFKGELQIKTNTQNAIWLYATVTPLTDTQGITTRYLAILNDITVRKLFEEEIINSEKKFKSVINSVKEIIFQADNQREWTFLNQAWKEITNHEINDSLGSRIMNFIHPEDHLHFQQKIKQILSGKEIFCNFIIRIINKQGEYKWLEVFAKPTLNSENDITGFSGTMHDVSEKRKNEELLSRSYAFQRAILDSAKQAIISTDFNGIIKTFNGGAETMTGFTSAQIIGNKSIEELLVLNIPKTNKNSFPEKLRNILIKSKDEIESEIQCKNGRNKTILLSLSEIQDTNNSISGFLFICNDITGRKNAESEIKKLNTILEESPDFVSYYDLQGNLLYANRAYKEIRYNDSVESEINLYPSWAELILQRKAIPHALQHGSWKGETAIIDKFGNEIPVLQLVNIHRNENGEPQFRSSIMRDITQRKEYEKKLMKSEKRNRDLINYSQAIICTHDLKGILLSINPAGCTLLEYALEEMVGKKISEFMPVDYRSAFIESYLPALKNNKVVEGVLYLLSKSGKEVNLLYKNYKVDEPGAESYIIGFAQDITERIKAEIELKSAKQSAEESVKAKELFLANMSHEIRTPMNGIVGLTNILLKSTLSEKQKEYAESVKQSAENLLVIINDILDFSKIQAGKLEIVKAPFDIGNLFYNINQSFKLEATRKKIELVTILDDKLHTYLKGDSIRINQVLVNLISNSLKFTENGKIVIKATLLNETDEGCRINFSVTDTGIGIAKEKLEKIFNSFTQANADTSRKYGGTGLGLSIVRNILELMGSKIKVNSTPGVGSEFSFTVYLEKAYRSNESLQDQIEEEFTGKLKGIKILLAEDNKVNQLFASELLSEWGAQLDIADNGKIALEYLAKNKYDLILMDIQMPELSGIDSTKIIRKEFAAPTNSIPIIAMTANAMKGDDLKFKEAGMNDVVFKPFQASELYKAIIRNIELVSNEIISNDIKNSLIKKEENQVEFTLKHASLHVLKSFSRGKDSFIVKMLKVLLESVPPTAQELEKAIASQDWISVTKFSHKLIPNMNMMGNALLEMEMKWIEDISKETENDLKSEINSRWPRVKKELEQTLSDLEKAEIYYKSKETSVNQ